MRYCQTIRLKDGRHCVLRNGEADDAAGALENYVLTHAQTEWLSSYPDEISFTVEQEAQHLKRKADSAREIELVAVVDGTIVGLAGVDSIGRLWKTKHRASLGISIDRAYWRLGIGDAMIQACIACAKEAGYAQLELGVFEGNVAARRLYEKHGFRPLGVVPRAFRLRDGSEHDEVLMVLRLGEPTPCVLQSGAVTIRSERLSKAEYIVFLKRSDLGSQYPMERFETRIDTLVRTASISLAARTETGTLVGVLLGLTDFAYWLFITDLGVDRAYERQGIGKRLMQSALALAGGEKDIAVYLVANGDAIPFYEKLGMEKSNEVMQYNHIDWTDFRVE